MSPWRRTTFFSPTEAQLSNTRRYRTGITDSGLEWYQARRKSSIPDSEDLSNRRATCVSSTRYTSRARDSSREPRLSSRYESSTSRRSPSTTRRREPSLSEYRSMWLASLRSTRLPSTDNLYGSSSRTGRDSTRDPYSTDTYEPRRRLSSNSGDLLSSLGGYGTGASSDDYPSYRSRLFSTDDNSYQDYSRYRSPSPTRNYIDLTRDHSPARDYIDLTRDRSLSRSQLTSTRTWEDSDYSWADF